MAATAAAPAAPRSDEELTHRQILTIIFGLMTGMFLAALDQNIVGTAIRSISDDLKGLDVQAWVTTAYLITSTISTPIYGKLSDLYGRKKFFLAAIVIFVIGSLACTFATSMYMLAAFRAVQGLGAGGLMSLALAIIGDIVPPRERAKYQGYFLAVFGTSSVLGPVIGGFFAGHDTILGLTGWRWVFLINVPLGIIALGAVMKTLHLHHERRQARIDWWGATMLVVALVPLLTVAEQGREWGWTSTRSITAFVIGALGVLGFVVAEHRMQDDALIPLRIFRNRAIFIALTGGFVVGAGMFGAMMTLPQFYLQIINGSSPTMAGLQMLPMVLGMMIFSILSGQLMTRTGKIKAFPIIGVGIMTVVLFLLTRLHGDTPLWQVMVLMFFFGAGLGNVMQPLTLAVQAAVQPREIGMATSAATFFRQMGGTLGVAVFLSVLFNQLGDKMTQALTDAQSSPEFLAAVRDRSILTNPDNRAFVTSLQDRSGSFFANLEKDSSAIQRLDPRLAAPIKEGFAQSMDTIFLLGGIACAIGFVILLFMPNLTLSSKSAAAHAAEERRKAELGLEPLPADATHEERVLHDKLQQFLLDAAAAEAGGHTLDELADAHLAAGADPSTQTRAAAQTTPLPVTGGTVDAPAAAGAAAVGAAISDAVDSRLADRAATGDEQPTAPAPDAAPDRLGDEPAGATAASALGVSGTVTQAGGSPLAGARVTLADRSGRQVARTTTDDDGRYTAPVPAGGSYLLIVAADGVAPEASLVGLTDAAVRRDVSLSGTAWVSGRVTRRSMGGAEQRPLADALVTLTDITGQVVGSQRTSHDGGYVFERLSAGSYVLTAQSGAHRPLARTVDVSGSAATVCDLVLSAGGLLEGTVLAATDRMPVRHATVTLTDATGQIAGTAVTGDDGGYRFADLDEGPYVITAAGYAPVAREISVEDGAVLEHAILLGDAAEGTGASVAHHAVPGDADHPVDR